MQMFGSFSQFLSDQGCDAQFQDTLAVLNSDFFPFNPIRLSLCYIAYITIKKCPQRKAVA